MRTFKLPLLAMAGAMIALPAVAQEAAPATSQGTAPAAPGAAAPAQGAPATATTVTDAEVDKFATAVVAVDKINKDSSIAAAEKQPQMASAVTSSGLTPERFNSIATAMNTDSALQQKVGQAIQSKAPAAPAAGAPAAAPGGAPGATPPSGATPGTPPQGGM